MKTDEPVVILDPGIQEITAKFHQVQLPNGEYVDMELRMRNPLEIKLGAKVTFEVIEITHYVKESRRK